MLRSDYRHGRNLCVNAHRVAYPSKDRLRFNLPGDILMKYCILSTDRFSARPPFPLFDIAMEVGPVALAPLRINRSVVGLLTAG